MYTVILTEEAIEGARLLRKSNPSVYKKLTKLLDELKTSPYQGTGHPEPLTHLSGLWSRRLDKQNRLIYSVQDTKILVTVISVLGLYSDK